MVAGASLGAHQAFKVSFLLLKSFSNYFSNLFILVYFVILFFYFFKVMARPLMLSMPCATNGISVTHVERLTINHVLRLQANLIQSVLIKSPSA